MQEGNLVSSDVQAFTSRVLVNGIQRPVISWSVDRELSGDLPAQVVAVSGLTQATGSVEFASGQDITDGGLNPWNASTGWFPKKGDRVEIYAGDGTTEWKQFHGLIGKTTGSIGEGFQSTLIDDYDKLSAPFSHSAMLRVMPPLAWDGSEPYREAGLHPLYYVDRALRTAGFYCTPPREFNTYLYVPMQGSAWPHFGNLRSSSGWLNTVAPWGLGRREGQATYTPATSNSMDKTTQLSLMVAPDHASPVDVFIDYGTTNNLRLTVNSSRVAIALKDGVEICRLSLGSGTVVSMLAKSGQVSLATNAGGAASGAFSPSGTNSPMTGVRINASASSSVAGLQLSEPTIASHETSQHGGALLQFSVRKACI